MQHTQSYTTIDFDNLSFHDCMIHGVRWVEQSVSFDLDYILEWIHPSPGEEHYKFRVSKSVLSFLNVYTIDFNVEMQLLYPGLQVDRIRRLDPQRTPTGLTEWLWIVEFTDADGQIKLRATDFELKLIGNALVSECQWIDD